MADFNDFLNNILKPRQTTYQDSPMDPLAPDDAPINKVPAMEMDASDFEPATEADVPQSKQLMSQKDIDAIHALPPPPEMMGKKPAQPMPASIGDLGVQTSPEEKTPEQKKMDLYQQLLDAQKQATEDNSRLGTAAVIGQLGQAIASARGGKAADISGTLNTIKEQNNAKVGNVKQQIDELPKTLDIKRATEMGDPASDISKYMRETAYGVLQKLYPGKDMSGKLDNMSADQLSKLPGMKNAGQNAPMEWSATDRVDAQGNPIRYNRRTGEYSTADGKVIMPGTETTRDIARKDQLTGNYGYVNKNGMTVVPTNSSAGTAKTATDAEGKPKEYTYAEIAKGAPEQAEKFNKIKEKFDADMKESRDTATAVTNLSSKLASGKADGIDSGMLGSIQTQAAKMAGQKGVLTDADLEKFGGAGGWAAAAKRAITNAATGKMSSEDIAFFNRFNQLMGKSLEQDINDRSQTHINHTRQVLETTAPGLTSENAAKLLGTSLVAPAVQDPARKAGAKAAAKTETPKAGEVKRKTADGKTAIFDTSVSPPKFLRYEE